MSHTRAFSYANAGASSIPLKYGDFTAFFAREVSRVLGESREALTLHIFIAPTVEADHPPHSIGVPIECGEGLEVELVFLMFQGA